MRDASAAGPRGNPKARPRIEAACRRRNDIGATTYGLDQVDPAARADAGAREDVILDITVQLVPVVATALIVPEADPKTYARPTTNRLVLTGLALATVLAFGARDFNVLASIPPRLMNGDHP